jgi:uncharacterized protein
MKHPQENSENNKNSENGEKFPQEILEAATRLHIRPAAVQTYLDAGRGVRGEGVERRFHATVKPVGAACNLDCCYCYYLGKEGLLGQEGARQMQDGTLERFIVEYVAALDAEEIVFTWHGGEPTLLGLPFFRKVVELQRRHAPPGRRISNDIQTNGLLLDEAWCDFLAGHGFLVGLSLDGPAELHDRCRPTKQGTSSFAKAFAAVRLLRDRGITCSTLTTVNRHNARQPLEVYRFLRDEVGTRFMQFIPCVEARRFRTAAPGQLAADELVPAQSPRARPGHPESVVTEWSVDPEDWGEFLVRVFDEWSAHDRGKVKVNLFETMLAQKRGQPAMICSNAPICGKNVAVESDGRVFSCDHYVYPGHELGSLMAQPLAALVFSLKQLEFGLAKFNTLPSECRSCAFLKLCWGECPRTRILKTRDGEGPLSYLCAGWKKFFRQRAARL